MEKFRVMVHVSGGSNKQSDRVALRTLQLCCLVIGY